MVLLETTFVFMLLSRCYSREACVSRAEALSFVRPSSPLCTRPKFRAAEIAFFPKPLCIIEPTGFGENDARVTSLSMASGSDRGDGGDGEDGAEGDEFDSAANLGDWRTFRSRLASSGLPTEERIGYQSAAIDDESSVPGSDDPGASASSIARRPPDHESTSGNQRKKSVSKRNEELLKSQNAVLAEEYLNGVWAHEVPKAEVGGLVCRMPLEAELYRNKSSRLGKELRDRLRLDADKPASSSPLTNSDWRFGGGRNASEAGRGGTTHGVSVSPLAAKTVFWYRTAQSLVQKELQKVTESAEGGQINAKDLSPESVELLNLYMDNQNTWQEVCLVVENDEGLGTATTLVLNRPITTRATEELAKLLLYGQFGGQNVSQTQELVRFLVAFEENCAVYVGGPMNQGDPATVIHGIKNLPGAVEISPGTAIYRGGLSAAIAGVLAGKYNPLEFRFFVGKHSYTDGTLQASVDVGKYQAIACARPVALKQCIGLPKPLWHEVLELCGGELKEISSLELLKRDDIQFEEMDE